MRRRLFIQSGSAAAALTLAGCGGGGGGIAEAAADMEFAGASASSPMSVPGSARAARTSEIAYPFGSRLNAYVAGILPSESKPVMDAVLTKQYDAWKAANVVRADSVVPGGYAVQFSNKAFLTVSEGMGYGMLLTVLFAGHDPEAKTLFDGMLAVVRARPSYGIKKHFAEYGEYLMEWRLYADGSSGGEGWNAFDGDEDIAMALLMADRQWGSHLKWNYKQEALNTIGAMKAHNMKPDGTTKGLSTNNVSRTSDYMIGHFRAYAAATGDTFWSTKAIDRAYHLLDKMQKKHSPKAGLMPDFIVNTDTEDPIPSPGFMGDMNANEHYFWWNACRNPWRFASDYVLSGDKRFADVTGKMIDFFQSSSGGDPYNIGTGYAMDGTKVTGGNSPAYHGPICAGACVDARFQEFLDKMWAWNAKHLTTGYYDGEIQLLSMVVASGNWWTP